MTQYTTHEAQERFDELLDEASRSGSVEILRSNGQTYILRPQRTRVAGSDLDVPPVQTNATTQDIVSAVRDSREGRH